MISRAADTRLRRRFSRQRGIPKSTLSERVAELERALGVRLIHRTSRSFVVTESAAICAYLADAFPAAGLAPPLQARGAYYRWLFFAAGPLEAAVTNRTLGVTPPAEQQGMVGYGSFGAVMEALEHAVAATGTSAPEGCRTEGFRIALDIGHTPRDPGAISARGRTEFSFNRVLALELYQGLVESGFQPFLINEDGGVDSLEQRTLVAQEYGANLFLSVHHDSVQPHYLSEWIVDGRKHYYSDHFRGYSLFVSKRNPQFRDSLRFATLLGRSLGEHGLEPTLHHAEPTAGENRPLLDAELGVHQCDNLVVLRTAAMPAVLLEAGVIVHRAEELQLSDPEYRQRYVDALVQAVTAYCTTGDTILESRRD